ncbi:MAG: hypothetical protein ACTSW7_03745 [Candidatus Thorarchaeota archaeon]
MARRRKIDRVNLKTRDILNALESRYKGNEYAFFLELRVGTGYDTAKGLPGSEQRIDAFAMSCWPSSGFERTSFEIKVSRGDWLKELKRPYKRLIAHRLCNRFYFVTPKGLISKEEIPLECGLMEVDKEHNLRIKIQAPFHESDAPTWIFVASLARRVKRTEVDNV